MPSMIAALPKDERGFPVPFFAPIRMGQPEFSMSDQLKLRRAIREQLCWVCGMPLIGKMAFVGGPLSVENRIFSDAPSHVECAEYAVQVCPFLAMPNYVKRACKDGIALPGQVDHKPDRVAVYVTDGYKLVMMGDSPHRLFRANPTAAITWWKDGVKL